MDRELVEIAFKALGTDIEISLIVRGDQKTKAEKDLAGLKEFYFQKEKIFSRFDSGSELCQLNQNLNQWTTVSSDLLAVAVFCQQYWQETGGIFDPRIIEPLEKAGYRADFKTSNFSQPNLEKLGIDFSVPLDQELLINRHQVMLKRRMDVAGIAKGYITDQAARRLKELLWKDFIVDSGGDMFIAGKNLEGNRWDISVEGLAAEQMMFSLSEQGIATSGISRRKWEINGQRFHHLINPQSPSSFNFDLRSVTVIADSAMVADVWAKVFFLKGRQAGIALARQKKLQSVFLSYDGAGYVVELDR